MRVTLLHYCILAQRCPLAVEGKRWQVAFLRVSTHPYDFQYERLCAYNVASGWRREDELLEQLCSGNYDAIVYNPAGFREPGFASSTCLTSDARASSDEVDPQQRDSSQQQQMDFAALHCLANRSALEYGLRRARCPVVRIFPRDNIRFETNGFPVERTAIGTGSGNGEHYGVEAGGSIAGFSGVDSYRLAIAAVASMLDESWTLSCDLQRDLRQAYVLSYLEQSCCGSQCRTPHRTV